MRRQKRGFSMNLDSLMDTMTNVVGILLILLAVTQLSAGKAVKNVRFKPGSGVSTEEFERTEKTLAGLRSERAGLERELKEYQAQIQRADRARGQSRQLAELQRRVGDAELPGKQELETETASLEKRIADLNEKIAALEQEIEARQSALAVAQKEGPKVMDVTIPVLTPAPSGLKPVSFICRHGRIYPLDHTSLWQEFMKALREVTGQRTEDIQVGPGDMEKIVAHLDQHDVGDKYIRLRIDSSFGEPRLRLEPRGSDRGEAGAQLSARRSVYMQRLRSIDPKKEFLMFFVWCDSFETYISARDLAKSANEELHGTWIPYGLDQELRRPIFGAPTQGDGDSGGPQWLF